MKSKMYNELRLKYVSRNVKRALLFIAVGLFSLWLIRTMNETNDLLTVLVCHDLNSTEQSMLACIDNQ